MKYWRESLYLVCIWSVQCFAVDEMESFNDATTEKIYSCDYKHLGIQLEQQLNQQKLLFYKINELSIQIKGIEAKLFEKSETQEQPVDENIIITTEIREKLKEHDNMLAKILNNQNDNQELCKKNDLEDHTQTLKNTISDKMIALQEIDAKLTNIEGNFMQKNISFEIINNQNNIQNLLEEMNLKDHTQTQTINSLISEKFDLMPEINEKLTIIANNSISKNDQLKFYQDIQQHLDSTETYLKSVNSTFNSESYEEHCKKNDLEDHTQTLKNTISDNIIALQEIDAKLTNIEGNFMQKNISFEIINNQNNIQNLLEEMNLKDHTQNQTIMSLIWEKLDLMPKIDEKLTIIANNSIPKNDELKLYQDIQQHLNATGIYLKSVNSTSNSQSDLSYCSDNKRLIKNHLYGPEPFLVPCRENGGVWTVIQRRIDGSVDFYRGWTDYKSGFGNVDGEFFIGLEKLYALTTTLKPVELLIILEDFENVTKYAMYDDFQVANEAENYKLMKVGTYVGDAGDSFSQHVGYNFTTKDRDNDIEPNINCADEHTGAWWYRKCHFSNLNGKYYQHPEELYNATTEKTGIKWKGFHGFQYSLKSVQMLIRPKKF